MGIKETTFVKQNGQTLVIMMLILVVVLTIGLSAVGRTITNVRETSTSERSSRAFSAAEAGVESTLRQDLSALLGAGQTASLNLDVGTGKSNVTISKSGGSAGAAYQPAKPVVKDDTIQVNLAGFSGQLSVYWASKGNAAETGSSGCAPGDATGAASLEIAIIQAAPSYGITRYNVVPAGCTNSANNFTISSTPSNSPDFFGQFNITVPANPAIMRIRPLYNQATIRVAPQNNGTLPVQAYKIRSEGTTGDTKRVVEVEKSIGGLPSVFDYAIYNGSTSRTLSKE